MHRALSEHDEALAAELNDDPSPASEALVDIVLRVHRRAAETFAATGVVARFRRELRIKSYVLDGWRAYVRELQAPRTPVRTTAIGPAIEALLGEFERRSDPLLWNNLVLAHQVALGAEPSHTIRTEAERMAAALAELAAGRATRGPFLAEFGHCSLRPYELSDPRFHELDAATLAKVAALAGRSAPPAREKRTLEDVLATREPGSVDVLVAVRELARSRTLLVVDELRARLLEAQAALGLSDVFAQPVEQTLAALRAAR